MEDLNNRIYIPFNTFQYRYWDQSSFMKDDLDGIDLRLKTGADSVETAKIVTAVLNSTHKNTEDFTVTIPAALLAQQQRTQAIFTYVMVAIAAISLLVGGIGIMNIVLATVMERTREIGVRRATGARRVDIVRQFLAESTLISIGGGLLGIALRLFSLVADRFGGAVEDDRDAAVGDRGLRRVGGGRRGFRDVPGDEGGAHRPDRGAALRMRARARSCGCTRERTTRENRAARGRVRAGARRKHGYDLNFAACGGAGLWPTLFENVGAQRRRCCQRPAPRVGLRSWVN